ncbi:Eco57I restriction-modification methylase domain-containing protein [Streptacidiphilus melanogenes]|uniref:Eco57I restriction-modification methylase domain-containing protein n=1 Tax=Streptacidiphilus melanogenes TaxID=411235 RepID=UPI0005AA746D|nr:DNA methyltransferase [Streptacidiphilus melanogenes]
MSATARNQVFTAVHTIGALLPADMLLRISEGKDVSGSTPADYHLVGSRNVQDEAERHWDYLKGIWRDLRAKLPYAPDAAAPADPTGLGQTQWLEPLFAELGFGRLTRTATGIPSDDGTKTFPISHRWQHVPIHLTAWNTDLDKRPAPGTVPPQSLVQECLNRTDAHLWALLSNGRQLRLLRDSTAMTGAAYVEFDLEAILDGELFSEFVLLYRLLHVSRFEVAEGAAASVCRLEKWRTEAIESGVRALDQLREGVRTAITTLGTGFLRHPANTELRETVDVRALHYALLRLVYRLLFLFVAEDRGALLHPDADETAQRRYRDYFSSARLRRHAERRRGTAHGDLYQALNVVLTGLGSEDGRPELGLPGLGGIFDDADADKLLHGLNLANEDLLTAIRALAIVYDTQAKRNRTVDYQHLGAEELGSVYESLLELVPKHDAAVPSFELVEFAGNTRKTTGSYYTPTSLIECLLDSALDPVINDAVKRGEDKAARASQADPRDAIVQELLSLTVCDPACGSGHFLVASARRIAKQVAAVREQNPEPTVGALRAALRDVVARCIYGVDLNPMAVELAKVSLWLEALEPGKALGFLDAHIKRGNALIGTTPGLLQNGIPDDAFKPIEGDDKKHATALKKLNAKQAPGQEQLFETELEVKVANLVFATSLHQISTAKADDLRDVRKQAEAYREWEKDTAYLHARHVADAWCAAFVWPKRADAPQAPTNAVFRAIQNPSAAGATAAANAEIVRLAKQYDFFHWHLEFPEVFRVSQTGEGVEPAGWSGGFSFIGGNPPWEHIELKEQEFFAARDAAIAEAAGAKRKKLIDQLPIMNPDLAKEFEQTKRQIDGLRHFASNSDMYPLCGRGRIKTDPVFAEQGRRLVDPRGRFGMILPTGIATDATTQHFFKDIVNQGSLVALYDFENRSGLFPAVDSRMKFSLLSLAGRATREPSATFAFFLQDPTELDAPDKRFTLTPEEITLLNPNTGTCPIFRARREAEITLGIYRRVPILIQERDEQHPRGSNPWGVSFTQGLFNMTSDSHLFHTREELERDGWSLVGNVFGRGNSRMLPLYEAKMAHHFDHRWATYNPDGTTRDLFLHEKEDPTTVVAPRYWVAEHEVDVKLASKHWDRDWLLGWRDICRATDERTAISFAFPKSGVGNKIPLMYVSQPPWLAAALVACQSSIVHDFASRQKMGGVTMNFFIWQQLPVLTPERLRPFQRFILPRIVELTYTAYDMTPFGRDLGDSSGPFHWDEERRTVIRAELDALFFLLYGIARDDVDYIMESFPIVKRKDVAKHGSYRTKELVLDLYDRMTAAGPTVENRLADPDGFSSLTPPPGQGERYPDAGVS